MRAAVIFFAMLVHPPPVPAAGAQTLKELQRALIGSWAGTLEYRDFSEPAQSTKRVKLPTWLGIELVGADLRFSYIYDDGPTKTVKESAVIHIDPVASRYSVADLAGKVEITRETAATGEPFAFRHAYALVRAAPAATGTY